MERLRKLWIIFLVGIIIWLFLMIQASSAAEEILVQFPNLSAGDCWILEDGEKKEEKLEFLRQEGKKLIFSFNSGKRILYKTLHFGDIKIIDAKTGEVLVSFKENPPLLKFPLFVGKKWDFAFHTMLNDGARRIFYFSYEAKSFKKVVVKAGEFDAFEVVCQLRLSGTKNGILVYKEDTLRYWYAPKVKYFVKTDGLDSTELVEYKVK